MFRYVLAGLMVIAMASVASADHKPQHSPGGGGGTTTLGDLNCTTNQVAKFNGGSGAWECAPDEIGGDSFVVVDNTGQIIRHTTIDDNLGSAVVAVDVQFLGETVTVVHRVFQNGIVFGNGINSGAVPGYVSSDCSGQPLYNASEVVLSSILPSWRESAIVIDPFAAGGPNLDARLIFFFDRSLAIPDFTVSSWINDGGGCNSSSRQFSLSIPFTEDQFSDDRDDFHVLFPPPYRICPVDDIDCITGNAGP